MVDLLWNYSGSEAQSGSSIGLHRRSLAAPQRRPACENREVEPLTLAGRAVVDLGRRRSATVSIIGWCRGNSYFRDALPAL